MKIYFDNIIFSLQKSGGISVYWSELLKRCTVDKNFEVFCVEQFKAKNYNFFRKSINLPQDRIIIETDIKLNRIFPILSNLTDNHIFHSSYYRLPLHKNKKSCIITTIHDFIPERYKVNDFRSKIIIKQKYISLKKSDGIICVSENTKKDLLLFYPEFSSKEIKVIHNGASNDFKQLTENESITINKFNNKPYCIYIGKRDGYKNFNFAVEFINSFPEIQMIIIGGGEFYKHEKQLLENKIKNRYYHIDFLPNNELNILFNQAEFLLYPSEYEGFGIPIIEAQKSGCPIIANKTSSINELVENKNLLLGRLDIKEASRVFKYIKENRKEVIDAGVKSSSEYTWENSYSKHNEFYYFIYEKNF